MAVATNQIQRFPAFSQGYKNVIQDTASVNFFHSTHNVWTGRTSVFLLRYSLLTELNFFFQNGKFAKYPAPLWFE